MNVKDKYRPIEGTKRGDGIIKILDEKYKDVSVSIGKVTIQENKDDKDEAILSYEYNVIELPKNIELDEDFDNFLGDIVFDIIESSMENNPDSLRFNSAD